MWRPFGEKEHGPGIFSFSELAQAVRLEGQAGSPGAKPCQLGQKIRLLPLRQWELLKEVTWSDHGWSRSFWLPTGCGLESLSETGRRVSPQKSSERHIMEDRCALCKDGGREWICVWHGVASAGCCFRVSGGGGGAGPGGC